MPRVRYEMATDLLQEWQLFRYIFITIRGICRIRPGIPGISDRIRVRSIVGRYLEHSRIYMFENGSDPEVYIGSADWMPLNLRRRVEILCPVEDPVLVRRIQSEILSPCPADNIKAREVLSDGDHRRVEATNGRSAIAAQEILMGLARGEQFEIPDFFAANGPDPPPG